MSISTAPQSGGMPSGQIYGAGVPQPSISPVGEALFKVADTYLQTQTNKKIAQRNLEGQIAGQTREGLDRVRSQETFLNQIFGKSATLQGAEQAFATAAITDKFNDLHGRLQTDQLFAKKPEEFNKIVQKELEPFLATGDAGLDSLMLQNTYDLQNKLFNNYSKMHHEYEQELYIQGVTADTLAKVESAKNSEDYQKLANYYYQLANSGEVGKQALISQLLGEVDRGESTSVIAARGFVEDPDNPLNLSIEDRNKLLRSINKHDENEVESLRKAQTMARAYSLSNIQAAAEDVTTDFSDLTQMIEQHRNEFGFDDDRNFGKWVSEFSRLELSPNVDSFVKGYELDRLKSMSKDPNTSPQDMMVSLENYMEKYNGVLTDSDKEQLGALYSRLNDNILSAEQAVDFDPIRYAQLQEDLNILMENPTSNVEEVASVVSELVESGGDAGSKTEANLLRNVFQHSMRQNKANENLAILSDPSFKDVLVIEGDVAEDTYLIGMHNLQNNPNLSPEGAQAGEIHLLNRLPVIPNVKKELQAGLQVLVNPDSTPNANAVQTLTKLQGMYQEAADSGRIQRYLTEAETNLFMEINDRLDSGMDINEAILDYHVRTVGREAEGRLPTNLKNMYGSNPREFDKDFKKVSKAFDLGSTSSRKRTLAQVNTVGLVREEMARIARRNPDSEFTLDNLREMAINNIKDRSFDGVTNLPRERIAESRTLAIRQNSLMHKEDLRNQINYYLSRKQKDIPYFNENDKMVYNPLNDSLMIFRTSGEGFEQGSGTVILDLKEIEDEWSNSFTYKVAVSRFHRHFNNSARDIDAAMGFSRDYSQRGASWRAATSWALPQYQQEALDMQERRERFIQQREAASTPSPNSGVGDMIKKAAEMQKAIDETFENIK